MGELLPALRALPLEQPLATFVFTVAGGAIAQLVSAWMRLPSIVFLLLAGILLGPEVLGWVQPGFLEGNVSSYVRMLVVIILFEGSMALRFYEVRTHGKMVRRLVTLGAAVTFVLTLGATKLFMDVSWMQAVLFGSLMVVTGPTVIIPLLKRLKAHERVHSILKWEGILTDPVGGILAVLCLEFFLSKEVGLLDTLGGFGSRLLVGSLLGAAAGWAIGWLFRKRFLLGRAVEELGGMLGIAFALLLYAVCETVLHESGLIGATVLGIFLGHTKFPYKHQIVMFKEQVTTVAISVAFVLLAASIRLESVTGVLPGGLFTVLALMFVVRPVGIWLCALGTNLNWREKLFLSLIAPRGIVAVTFAFLVGDILARRDPLHEPVLVPLVFLACSTTVLFSGLLGVPLGRILGVNEEEPRGLLVVGANAFARQLSRALASRGVGIRILDNNLRECQKAGQEGWHVYHGDPTDQRFMRQLDVKGVSKLLAVTPYRENNILTCQIGARLMDNDRVFRFDARPLEKRTDEAGSETWGLPISHVGPTPAELVALAEEGRLTFEWKPLEQALARFPEPTGEGPWVLGALHKDRFFFTGERVLPKGAEALVMALKPVP